MKDYKYLITNDLINLGISKGDTLLVHSSLSSLGKFDHKAQIVVEALKQVLGPSGTLLMPALSYESVTEGQSVFDTKHTPSCVGGLTEYFRQLPDTLRSMHPTHSVCAFGRNAALLLDEHQQDNTPCGLKSPFRKLKDIDGKLFFLGCGLQPNTSIHAIEELSQPEYLFGKTIEYELRPGTGKASKKNYLTHDFEGFTQRYDRVTTVLDTKDYSYGNILEAEAYLVKAAPMWRKANKKLIENSLFFVDKI